MDFAFDPEYNDRLYEERHVGFETALEAISTGKVLFEAALSDQSNSTHRVLVVAIGDNAYYVPYTVADERWRLQTVYPATAFTHLLNNSNPSNHESRYLNDEEREIIEGIRGLHSSGSPKPNVSNLRKMKKGATKALKRQRSRRTRISPDGPPDTEEHFGEIGGRVGKVGRW